MPQDLRPEIERLQAQAEDISRIVSDEGHFPAAAVARLLEELVRTLGEVAARCPRLQERD